MWPTRGALMIVINSSPAINLARALGAFELLPELYGTVIVLFEVMREIESGAARDETAKLLRNCAGVEIRAEPVFIPAWLAHELDAGEAAVIQTALSEEVMTVVLDDRKARRAATLAGLEVTGSLGVLVLAKQLGKLTSVRDAANRMKAGGAWLDPALVDRALELAGEL
jgi:predicted nucleic acid-binding protein